MRTIHRTMAVAAVLAALAVFMAITSAQEFTAEADRAKEAGDKFEIAVSPLLWPML